MSTKMTLESTTRCCCITAIEGAYWAMQHAQKLDPPDYIKIDAHIQDLRDHLDTLCMIESPAIWAQGT